MIEPSKNQAEVAQKAIDWFYNSPDMVFQISGGPGTGKSFLLHYIVSQLGLKWYEVAPMTFTGAAAIVMRKKGFSTAKTMHSWLLKPVKIDKKDKEGRVKLDTYFNIPQSGIGFIPIPLNTDYIRLVVVDEGKMVPKPMRELLEKNNVKTIVAGDVDQLDPVGYESAYLTTGEVHMLTEIFRQKRNSGIVHISQRIKQNLPIHCGVYNNCCVIYDDEVTPQMLLNADAILCARNATRDNINNYIRQDLNGLTSWLPSHGEKVICRANDWNISIDEINLANGLIGTVENYPDVTSITDQDIFEIDFKPYLLDRPFKKLRLNLSYFRAPYKDKSRFKNHLIYPGHLFEYAYAITTHLAQGSEYQQGIFFEEYLNRDIDTQLKYTGITRFSDYCIYVKKRRRYY